MAVQINSKWEGWRAERVECEEEEFIIACQVRELRESGNSWLKIGAALALQTNGKPKSGAARARKIYAIGFGSVPRTRGENSEEEKEEKEGQEEARPKAKKSKSTILNGVRRRDSVKSFGEDLFQDLPDEKIIAEINDKKLEWTQIIHNDSGEILVESQESAWVNPRSQIFISGMKHDPLIRVLNFRESDRDAPLKFRHLLGPFRAVRLDRITRVSK